MSTYYSLGCHECKKQIPLWGRWAGSSGLLSTAHKYPDLIQEFIHDHLDHGIVLLGEGQHEEYDDYHDVTDDLLDDYGNLLEAGGGLNP